MNLNQCHGLRHAYAQRRYHELTCEFHSHKKALLCPIEGGKSSKLLNRFERSIDIKAREILSRELGHTRLAITKIYLG